MNSLVNIGLIITYLLLGITALAAIGLPLIYFIKNFEIAKAKNSFMSIIILLVVFLITYFISSGDVSMIDEKFGVSPTGFKLIGGSIITTYILVIVAFIVAVYTEATNKMK